MPTEMELTLEQTQQGVSYEVSVDPHGLEGISKDGDGVSSCSTSKLQEKTQLSRSRYMNSLREVKSQFKFLLETLQDFGNMPIFKRTFSQDLDLLEHHLIEDILSQTDCKSILTKLKTTFENAFNSEFKECMQKYTRFNA
ncbi:hypothetical protein Tco_1267478 [Tanacetum coccineum]